MIKWKNKSMSKRELVSYIHTLTGLSFKKSRILCKKAKFSYLIACYFAYLAFGKSVGIESIKYCKEPFNNPKARIIN